MEAWSDILVGLLRASLQTIVLVLLVLLLRALLGRWLTPRWRYALWLLVVVRLILPVTPSSPSSLFNWLPDVVALGTQPADREPSLASPFTEGSPLAEVQSGGGSDAGPASEPLRAGGAMPRRDETSRTGSPDSHFASELGRWCVVHWRALLAYLWLAGVGLLTAHLLISSHRLRVRIGLRRLVTDSRVLNALEDCRQRVGLRVPITIVETDEVSSPALYGFLRPRLLLPPGLGLAFSDQELAHVFFHELAHVRSRDIVLNWLVMALQILHWPNPFVWLAFHRLRADRELVRDAAALRFMGNSGKKAYGTTMLRLLQGAGHRVRLPELAGILERQSHVRQRLKALSRSPGGAIQEILGLILIVGLGLTVLTDAITTRRSDGLGLSLPGSPGVAGESGVQVLTSKILFQVFDAKTGHVLPECTISSRTSVSGGEEVKWQGSTDAEGRGEITVSAEVGSRFDLAVEFTCPGYVARAVRWSTDFRDEVEDLPSQYEVRISPATEIGGMVLDEGRRGISGAVVQLRELGEFPVREREVLSPIPHYETTDAAGHWTCDHVSPRQKALVATVRDSRHRPVTFFSSGVEAPEILDSGQPIVAATDLYTQSATIVMKDGLILIGAVTDGSGAPIVGARVTQGKGSDVPFATVETDSEGRFRFDNAVPGETELQVQAGGYFARRVTASVADASLPIEIQLESGGLLRGRVVDDVGVPLAQVRVSAALDTPFSWDGVTDEEGRFEWDAAPKGQVSCRFVGPGGFMPRTLNLEADSEESVIRLTRSPVVPRVRVQGEVTDRENQAPIDRFRVKMHFQIARGLHRATLQSKEVIDGRDGIFRTAVEWPTDAYEFEIQAEGYLPQRTGWFLRRDGDRQITLSLRRGASIAGVVRLPGGGAATGAEVGLATPDTSVILGVDKLLYPELTKTTKADAFGRFSFGPEEGDFLIVAVHPAGYAEISAAEFNETKILRLQPWGRIEGRLTIADQPRPGVRTSAGRAGRRASGAADEPSIVMMGFSAQTDDAGRFVIPRVPPVECVVRPAIKNAFCPGERVIVSPGSTQQVTLALSEGRVVVGRLTASDPNLVIHWDSPSHTFTVRGLANEQPGRAEAGSPAFVSRELPNLGVAVESDGSFRLEGIPQGTYRMEGWIKKESGISNAVNLLAPFIASVSHDFEVTNPNSGETTVALNLGVLNVEPLGRSHVEAKARQP